MRATLSFDLGNPDDRREFRVASRAMDLHVALSNIQEEIRRLRKYGPAQDVDPNTIEHVERLVLDEVGSLLEE